MRSLIQPVRPVRPVLYTLLSAFCFIALGTAFGQMPELPSDEVQPVPEVLDVGVMTDATGSEYVSIQVDGGTITQVLNAFAIQTGRNVVIGPEVISEGVSIHLSHVRWDEALEVILKPYGFGYRKVGDTIVISKLEKLASLEAVEPLQTKVFNLQFVDAGDVKDMLQGQLSARGSMSIMVSRGKKGWSFASQGEGRAYSKSGVSLAKRARAADEDQQAKSKTIVVTDIPGVLNKIAEILAEVDKKPTQILVESKFVEVNENYLRDIGVELSGNFDLAGANIGFEDHFYDTVPNAFNPASTGIAGLNNLNTFGRVQVSSSDVNALLNLLQEDDDSKVLSAPRILTLNNQEATIIVGQKYPIIESDVTGSTSLGVTSTTLDYYENIGIQLNVVPQTSGDGYINMIVHPSVSSIIGFATGSTGTQVGTNTTQTAYPIINIRETETQILLRDSETIVIGGLLEEREGTTVLKVPFLGDIPIIGRLFRRETDDTSTVDLLIFLTATVVDIDEGDLTAPVEEEVKEDVMTVEIDVSEADIEIEVEEDVTIEEM